MLESIYDMVAVSRKILCVDDQQEILDLLAKQLDGYECSFANSGPEALSMLQSDGPFAVVLSDYAMPDMDGIELLREVHERLPQTVSIMLTAHNELAVAVEALHEGHIFRFLSKPWDKKILLRNLDLALEQYRLMVSERILAEDLQKANIELSDKVLQLQEMNQFLQQWVEFSPAVIYRASIDTDNTYKTIYVSRNMDTLIGFDRLEMIENTSFWTENIHDDDRQNMLDTLQGMSNDFSGTQSCEYRVQHKDGQYVMLKDTFRFIPSSKDDHFEIVGAWLKCPQV